jgi:hypothetical protein
MPTSVDSFPKRIILILTLLLSASCAIAEEFEAISSRVSPGYTREKFPDGSLRPENYAFGEGGCWSSARDDKSIDKMTFTEVVRTIAPTLAAKNYLGARDPKATKLLIMVYWGTTHAPEHASDSMAYVNLEAANSEMNREVHMQDQKDKFGRMRNLQGNPAFDAVTVAIAAVQAENRMRDLADRKNAMMLGYDSWWDATFNAPNGTPLEIRKRDMLNELENDRYFVVLMAYDFQLLWKEKKHSLLWETRFSVSEHTNRFDEQLGRMALEASKYFGRDSNGLTHSSLPDAQVDIGDVKSLGVVPQK